MKLSNYIYEHSINNVDVADIFAEQAAGEFRVANAIAQAYLKEAIMLEYATEKDSVNVFQEASFSETIKGAAQKTGDWFKKVWEAIAKFFKMIFGKIKAFFSKKKVDALDKKIDDITSKTGVSEDELLVPITHEQLKAINLFLNLVENVLIGSDKAPESTDDRFVNVSQRGQGRSILGILEIITNSFQGDTKYRMSADQFSKLIGRLDSLLKTFEKADLKKKLDKTKSTETFKDLRAYATKFTVGTEGPKPGNSKMDGFTDEEIKAAKKAALKDVTILTKEDAARYSQELNAPDYSNKDEYTFITAAEAKSLVERYKAAEKEIDDSLKEMKDYLDEITELVGKSYDKGNFTMMDEIFGTDKHGRDKNINFNQFAVLTQTLDKTRDIVDRSLSDIEDLVQNAIEMLDSKTASKAQKEAKINSSLNTQSTASFGAKTQGDFDDYSSIANTAKTADWGNT